MSTPKTEHAPRTQSCRHEQALPHDQCGGTLHLRDDSLIGCHRATGHAGRCCFEWYFRDDHPRRTV